MARGIDCSYVHMILRHSNPEIVSGDLLANINHMNRIPFCHGCIAIALVECMELA